MRRIALLYFSVACIGTIGVFLDWDALPDAFKTECRGNQTRSFFVYKNMSFDWLNNPTTEVNIDLQEGCGVDMAHGRPPHVHNIGLSVSFDRMSSTHAEDLKASLAYMAYLSERERPSLKFCLCDDKHAFNNAISIYDYFFDDPQQGATVDFRQYATLGPWEPLFAPIMGVRADSSGKNIILWSFNKDFYNFSLTGGEPADTTVVDEVVQLEYSVLSGTLSSPNSVDVTSTSHYRRLQAASHMQDIAHLPKTIVNALGNPRGLSSTPARMLANNFDTRCWLRDSSCAESFTYGSDQVDGCTVLGGQSIPWCSHDTIYSGGWSACKPLCVFGQPPRCPAGYNQTSRVIFECNGTLDDTISIALPADNAIFVEAFTIPASAIDFTLNISSSLADFDLLVYDPLTAQEVVQRQRGVVSKYNTVGGYLGVSITYDLHELGSGASPYTEAVIFSGVMPRAVSVRLYCYGNCGAMNMDQRKVDVAYSFVDFEACPLVPSGCDQMQITTTTQTTLTTTSTTTTTVNLLCESSYFRSQVYLFGCQGEELSKSVWISGGTLTVLELPVNLEDVEVFIESDTKVSFILYDPALSKTVVADSSSAPINSGNMIGVYEGVTISYGGGSIGTPVREGVVVTGKLTRTLWVNVYSSVSTTFQMNLQVKHNGWAETPCPQIPFGCVWYNASDPELTSARVSWAERFRLRYFYGWRDAWDRLASAETFTALFDPEGISWSNFVFLWLYGFGAQSHQDTDLWKKAFRESDSDNNGHISLNEFKEMYLFEEYVELDPDGSMWSIGLTRVFDINIPMSMYPSGALMNLYVLGARTIFAISDDSEQMRFTCQFTLDYAVSRGYQLLKALQPLSLTNATAVLGSDAIPGVVDVFLVCTTSLDFLNVVIIDAMVRNLNPKAWLFQSPFGASLSSRMEAYIINYFVEPVPWSAPTNEGLHFEDFPSCDLFYYQFEQIFHNASLIVAQMLGALTVLHAAIGNASSFTPDLETAAFGNFLRTQVVNTCWGDIRVDTKGKRVVPQQPLTASQNLNFEYYPKLDKAVRTRQFHPLPQASEHTLEHMARRFYTCSIELCSSNLPDARRLTMASFEPTVLLNFEGLSFANKMEEVYACDEGCDYVNLVCSPCLPGKFRHREDLVCKSCIHGKYSNQFGLPNCKDCPDGALCEYPDQTPTSLAGYFRIDITEIDGPFHNYQSYITPGEAAGLQQSTFVPKNSDICFNGSAPERYFFYKCSPKSICEPDNTCPEGNTGIFCANCENMYSYYGGFKALRQCQKCPSSQLVFVEGLALLAAYLLLFSVLSYSFEKAAKNQRNIVAPLFRDMLFHVQMLGAIAENSALGSADSLYNYFPGMLADLLINPYMLIKFDCFWDASERLGMYKAMIIAASLIPMMGGCLILSFHFFWYLFHELQFATLNAVHKRQFMEREPQPSEDVTAVVESKNFHTIKSENTAATAGSLNDKNNAAYQRSKRVRRKVLTTEHAYNMQSLIRHISVWVLLTYASVVSIAVQTNGCTDQLDKPRLRIDLDILCDTPKFQPLQKLGSRCSAAVATLLPFIIALCLIWNCDDFNSIHVRKTFGVFYVGYKETHWFWGVFQMIEVMMVIACGAFRSAARRAQYTLFVIVAMLILYLWQTPELDFDRHALRRFAKVSRASFVLTLVLMICINATEWDVGMGLDAFEFLEDLKKQESLIGAVLAVIQMFILLLGVFLILYNVHAVRLKTLRDGAPPDPRYRKPMRIFGSMFLELCKVLYGLNPMGLRTETTSDGQVEDTVVLKRLSSAEQGYLQFSLAALLKDCLDSSQTLSTALIGHAVSKALHTAISWRKSVLTDVVEASTVRNKPLRFDEERAGKGITVDEIFMATHTVGEDIMHHHPAMARLALGDEAEESELSYIENDEHTASGVDGTEHFLSDNHALGDELARERIRLEAFHGKLAIHDAGVVNEAVASSVSSVSRNADQRLMRLRDLEILKKKIKDSKQEVEHLRLQLKERQGDATLLPQMDDSKITESPQPKATHPRRNTLTGNNAHKSGEHEKAAEYAKSNARKKLAQKCYFNDMTSNSAGGDDNLVSDLLSRSFDPTPATPTGVRARRAADTGSEAQMASFLSFGSRVLSKFGLSPEMPTRSGREKQFEQTPALGESGQRDSQIQERADSRIQEIGTEEWAERTGAPPSSQRLSVKLDAERSVQNLQQLHPSESQKQLLPSESQKKNLPSESQRKLLRAECILDFHFPGKAGSVAVGIFKTMFFAALRRLGATDEHLEHLQFKVLAGSSDSIFIVRLQGTESSLQELRALEHKDLDVVGYVLQEVGEIVPAR